MATLGERGGIKCEDRVGQGVQDQRLGSPGGGLHPRCSVATPGEHKKFGNIKDLEAREEVATHAVVWQLPVNRD